jgi:hypothetical protein
MNSIKLHFALTAEQVVSQSESDCPRVPIYEESKFDFENQMKHLDQVGVSAYWLYGFRGAEGFTRDIGLLKVAKDKLERLGKEVYIVCEPLAHPSAELWDEHENGQLPDDPSRPTKPPAEGWRYRVNAEGKTDWGTACLNDQVVQDLVKATTAFRDAGFKKVFFDDDLRMSVGFGRQRWGDTIGGCFCDPCIAEFNQQHTTNLTREQLREIVLNPEGNVITSEQWVKYTCDKITHFMKSVNLPGIQVGIMVMLNGGRNHGIDLAAIQQAVPDCIVRVGEAHFKDEEFEPPAGKAELIDSIQTHIAQVGDISRLYSENTTLTGGDHYSYSSFLLSPDNMAQRLLIEVEQGLVNIMLMPPNLLYSPAHWEAIAKVLPEAEKIAKRISHS